VVSIGLFAGLTYIYPLYLGRNRPQLSSGTGQHSGSLQDTCDVRHSSIVRLGPLQATMLIAMLIVVVSGPRHGTNGPPGCVLLVAAITFMTRHRAENRAVYFLHKIGSGRRGVL
jgi:hypothetical protein